MSASTLGVDERHEVFAFGADRRVTVASDTRRLTVESLVGFPFAQVRTVAGEPHIMLEARGEQVTKPLVVRLDGNNAEEGRRILDSAAHPLVTRVDTMDGAAQRVAELAAAGV